MVSFLVLVSSLLLLIIPIVCFYVLQQLLATTSPCRLPPGPRPLPLIGNLVDVGTSHLPAHRTLAQLARRHGPLMTLHLGTRVTIIASSPSTARAVLHTHNGSLTGRSPPDTWLALGHASNSVFVLPPRRKWRALRRIGAEHLLSARQLDGAKKPLLRDAVLGLVRRVSESELEEAGAVTVEVGRVAFEATMEMQWRAMFSAGFDDDVAARELYDAAREAVALSFKPNVSDFFPVLAAADLWGLRRRFTRRLAVVYRMIGEQIERREGAGSSSSDCKRDLLDVVLDMSKQGTDKEDLVTVSRDFIRTFLTDMFLATVDTIACTVEWAMAELLQHPNTMTKLQEELRTVLDSSKTDVEHCDVDRLPYLQAVVRETLRLHPVVPLVPNEADQTVEIHGYTVPKGCTVLVNLWAVHRDPGAWPEPDKFMPERFLPRLEETGFVGSTKFDFIPFSAGRRACLGLPLATRMVHAMLGSLLHRFDWSLPREVKVSGLDMSDNLGLTMTMATPLRAIAKEKKNE